MTDLLKAADELRDLVQEQFEDGCETCQGDCSSANPPVTSCPMRRRHDALTAYRAASDGLHSDDRAVDRFSEAMKIKLKSAREKGKGGWDDENDCHPLFLACELLRHSRKSNAGTFEDIANFAMMLHQRGIDPKIMLDANDEIDNEMRAARESAGEVEVKPLEWEKSRCGIVSKCGAYSIGFSHWGKFYIRFFNTVVSDNDHSEEAQAIEAAQADYERRIRSALA